MITRGRAMVPLYASGRRLSDRHLLHGLALLAVREHALDGALPCLLQRGHVELLARGDERDSPRWWCPARPRPGCRLRRAAARRRPAPPGTLPYAGANSVVGVDVVELHAQAVAHAHLEQRLGHAAVARRAKPPARRRCRSSSSHGVHGRQCILGRRRDALGVVAARGHQRHAVAGALELGGRRARRPCPPPRRRTSSVGGTSSCSKLPDMESLPPMAPMPRSTCAIERAQDGGRGLAPALRARRAGFRNTPGSVRYTFWRLKPAATRLARATRPRQRTRR